MIPHVKHRPTGKVISAYYTVHPDDRQVFVDAVLPHLATTARQEGCVYYVFAQDLTDPNTIHLTEGWRDQAAIDAHFTDENFRPVLPDAGVGGGAAERTGGPARSWWVASMVSSCCCSCCTIMPNAKPSATRRRPWSRRVRSSTSRALSRTWAT